MEEVEKVIESASSDDASSSETESKQDTAQEASSSTGQEPSAVKLKDDTSDAEINPDATQSKADDATGDTPEYDPANVHYEGSIAIYTDPKSKYQYQWSEEKNEWIPRESAPENAVYGYEDDTHTYTDTDGVKYFWDVERKAWFPKVDDEFIAKYQMSYGFVDNTTAETDADVEADSSEKAEKEVVVKGTKRKPSEPTWFEVDEQQNNKVYVSNLPIDITEQEFVDFMQKCGLVMRDGASGKMKIKLYTEPNSDQLKGDALCTYIKIESVDMALNLLDGSELRGNKIHVERAKFQMKGAAYDPKLKPKKKKKKELEKLKKMQAKLFDWRPEKMIGERAKHEKVVIVKNLFEPSIFDREVSLILEYQQDLREECGKCGDVRRVVLYDRHPEGVVQITMKEPEEADAVVQLLNNRWFGQRKLTAEIWDGKTKFKIAETDSQISKRLDNWDKFLETDEAKAEEKRKADEAKQTPQA